VRSHWFIRISFAVSQEARESIAVIRVLGERSMKHNQDIFISFVDFKRAFDLVRWDNYSIFWKW